MKEPIKVVGIDLAKDVFQIHASDARGRKIFSKQVKRRQFMEVMAQLPKSLVGMESCGGAHHWAREIRKLGHEVRLIAPQHVRPYVKNQKNDMADAAAIAEAVTRPHMRFVGIKEVWQQDILSLHRIRSRIVGNRTAVGNEIRGLLQEYGIVFPKGISGLKSGLLKLFSETENGLTLLVQQAIWDLWEEWQNLDARAKQLENNLGQFYRGHAVCERIGKIEGIGPITATAIVGTVGDASVFRNGRQMAAWLGLVPRQCSSGGKPRLLGISKHGDCYVRKLLIHGARSVLQHLGNKDDGRSRWLRDKRERRGFNKACVALANKNARIVWALMNFKTEYRRVA